MEKCKTCDRQMIALPASEYDFEWQHEYDYPSEDYGGLCTGCDAFFSHKAVGAFCVFHGSSCIVANHYADAVHLCSHDECIEHQDITTLMINASYARWKDGEEENEFFDRMAKVSEELAAGTA